MFQKEILLQRLRDELKIRGYSVKTVQTYTFICKKFLNKINKLPYNVTSQELKEYMLYLINRNYDRETIRLTLASLKFFFINVVQREIDFSQIPLPKKKKSLPKVLSQKEIKDLIKVTTNTKHRLLIKFAYSSGLRVSELVKLKVSDLNIDRFVVRVNQGKGKKDRFSIFAKGLKEDLLKHLCERKTGSKYLFDGRKNHLTVKSVQLVLEQATKKARLDKKVTPHMLRHSFATHLLEQGIDIRYIQTLLGHSRLETTEIYTKVANNKLEKIKNPLDNI